MKRILHLFSIAMMVASLVGCSSVGGKVVEHKVKKAVPGVDTKGEKISKKADKAVGDDEGGRLNRDK